MVSRHIKIDVPCTFWFSLVFLWFSVFLLLTSSLALCTHTHMIGVTWNRIQRDFLSSYRCFTWEIYLIYLDSLRILFEQKKKIPDFCNILWKFFPPLECSIHIFLSFDVCFPISCSLVIFDSKCRIGLMVEPKERERERDAIHFPMKMNWNN